MSARVRARHSPHNPTFFLRISDLHRWPLGVRGVFASSLGAAKTTSSAEVAAQLAARGYSVLVVDMDPQGNLSDVFVAALEERDSVYELLGEMGE